MTGNIVQFVEIGVKGVILGVKIYVNGTTTVNEDYRELNDQFSAAVTQLRGRGEVNDFELERLCQECLSESSKLEQILNGLRDKETKFEKIFATLYRKGEIANLRKKLYELESRLHLLIR